MRQRLPEARREKMMQYIIGNHDYWVISFLVEALELYYSENRAGLREKLVQKFAQMFFVGYPCMRQKE